MVQRRKKNMIEISNSYLYKDVLELSNIRNSSKISKRDKIYFWDLCVRNTLFNNFAPLNMRNDTGALGKFYNSRKTKIPIE